MNRIIKFRAWNKEVKRMFCPHKITPTFQEDVELMQFTGLLDKNRKEIWEGDIVSIDDWEPSNYEVVFNRGGFCLKLREDSGFYPDIKYAEKSVVIGNIYENQNLLLKEQHENKHVGEK